MDKVDISEMVNAVKNKNLNLVEALTVKYQLEDVAEIRPHGSEEKFDLLQRERYHLHRWNVFHLAVKAGALDCVKFFCDKMAVNLQLIS